MLYALAIKAYDSGPFPDEVKTLMLARPVPNFGRRKTLFHLVVEALVARAMIEGGIVSPLREMVKVEGIRGVHFHRHHYLNESGKRFVCLGSGPDPDSAVGQLSHSVLERNVVDGCLKCGYGSLVEPEQHCEVCYAGSKRGVRTLLRQQGFASFGSEGWPVLKEMVGEKMTALLEDMSNFYFKINSDSCFADACFNNVMHTEGMSYLGGKADDWLFMRKRRRS